MSTVLEAARVLERPRGAPPGPPPPPGNESWRWRLVIGIAVLVIVGGGAIGWLVSRRVDPPAVEESPLDTVATGAVVADKPSRSEEPAPWGRAIAEPRRREPAPARPTRPDVSAGASRAASRGAAAPTGDAGIRVTAITYAEDAAERTVRVLVDGRSAKLHEGETANGIEVQLILPDRVYIRQGMTVFAVRP